MVKKQPIETCEPWIKEIRPSVLTKISHEIEEFIEHVLLRFKESRWGEDQDWDDFNNIIGSDNHYRPYVKGHRLIPSLAGFSIEFDFGLIFEANIPLVGDPNDE